jgi:hypothetical protein
MYSTCIYCHLPLGANEMIEHFPVGRKLAFDAHKGRLWVICTACSRWNLTPLEERWEAIEEAERIFGETRTRYSSENIGLARARDGLDLVRIGKPLRPEFAAWRYGAQFTRRRRRHLIVASTLTAGGIAAYWGTMAIGGPVVLSGLFAPMVSRLIQRTLTGKPKDVVANVEGTDGAKLEIRREDLARIELVPQKADRWGISLPTMVYGTVHLVDSAAVRVASLSLAHRNIAGASQRHVERAVAKLELYTDPAKLLRFLAKQGPFARMDSEQLMTLEMAANEDAERRALEGELRELELAWKDAEELAAIADNLFLPASVTDWIRRHGL